MRLISLFALVLFATAYGVELPVPDNSLVAIRMIVTGYCPCDKCCGPHASGLTATGTSTANHPTGIAAAPNLLPYGTQILVPGYCDGALQEVDDTGGAMRKDARKGVYHIDLRFRTHQEALAWGRREMTVYVKK